MLSDLLALLSLAGRLLLVLAGNLLAVGATFRVLHLVIDVTGAVILAGMLAVPAATYALVYALFPTARTPYRGAGASSRASAGPGGSWS